MQHFIDKLGTAFQQAELLAHPNAVVLPRFPKSIQLDQYSCGSKSVWCILRYYGIRISHARLERMLDTDEYGTSVQDIKRVFKRFRLEIKTLRKPTIKTLKRCISNGSPVLISIWDGVHYAVVFGYSPTRVFVMNPSLDVTSSGCGAIGSAVSRKAFRNAWDYWGIVVKQG